MYFDVNNLYSWAMRQPLSYVDFRVNDVTNFNSLIYRVKCNDVYEMMKRDSRFDTNDYPADNVYGMLLANKKC